MTHTVRASTFEGPFGLLLELVERGRMEVTELSVGDITARYLERVTAMGADSSETMGEFLQLGSRLLYIKSLALLPKSEIGDQEEEILRLNEELEEYRRFQSAARQLGRRSSQRTWQRGVVTRLPVEDLPLPSLTLEALSTALERALRRVEPAMPSGQLLTPLSQADVSKLLLEKLQDAPCTLDEVLADATDRLAIIVYFLAVLELLKDGRIVVYQQSQFDPLQLEACRV